MSESISREELRELARVLRVQADKIAAVVHEYSTATLREAWTRLLVYTRGTADAYETIADETERLESLGQSRWQKAEPKPAPEAGDAAVCVECSEADVWLNEDGYRYACLAEHGEPR